MKENESGSTIPEALNQVLAGARRVAVMTGAGISAESGIPTFRDAQTGLWAKYRAEDLATPEAFQRDPELVWNWYQWRRSLISKANPNPGHRTLARMAEKVPDFCLITQNVDGFHTLAGSPSVIELHGNIQRTKCFDAHHPAESWLADEVPPKCTLCQSPLRPDVVWFGEALPQDALTQAVNAARACEVFFSIGTSSVVYPAADIAFQAMRHGAVTVEINPMETPASSHFTHTLRGPAGKVLPQLFAVTWP